MNGYNMIGRFHAVAAAVALALSASTALAQQPEGNAPEQPHQQSQQPSSQTQQARGGHDQSAASLEQHGDSRLDQLVQMHQELGTFIQALETAGLVEELTGATQYTIFAPTNDAFEAMDKDVAELLKPENRQDLVALLRNHIVADDVDPQMARRLESAQTLDGDTIALSMMNDTLKIGEASVVTPSIQVDGSNLRIYSIDKVLGEGRSQSASATQNRSRG